jgi:hypothetical protein
VRTPGFVVHAFGSGVRATQEGPTSTTVATDRGGSGTADAVATSPRSAQTSDWPGRYVVRNVAVRLTANPPGFTRTSAARVPVLSRTTVTAFPSGDANADATTPGESACAPTRTYPGSVYRAKWRSE